MLMRCRLLTTFVLALAVANVRSAYGQQRPLPTEVVEGVGAGNIPLQAGADYTRDARFSLSGLQGNLWRIALLQIDVGLSQIADLEISGGLRDRLMITSTTPAVLSGLLRLTDPTTTSAFDDVIVGTRIRLRADSPGQLGFAVRVATRLPNAKHPSGLGQNTTDFFGTLIVGRTVALTHVTGNIGLGILGDPLQGNRRVHSLLYGAAISRDLTDRLQVVTHLDGRTGPLEPGLEPRAIASLGVAWTEGPTHLEIDGTEGLTKWDGGVGVAVNARFTFHAFTP
jgi:hypothetical protein